MRQIAISLDLERPIADQLGPLAEAWGSGRYRSVQLVLFCGTVQADVRAVAAEVLACSPAKALVGTMSAGEVRDGRLTSPGVLVRALLFESSEAIVRRYDHVKGNEASVGARIVSDLEAVQDARAAELILPGTELDTRLLYEELSRCDRSIQIFGGYSGCHRLNAPEHFAFDEEGIYLDSIFVTCFAGKELQVDADKLIGWDALGMPLTVTKAEGNLLKELDHRPAAEAYERFLSIDRGRDDNAEAGYEFPLIARYGGEDRLRSTLHIEEDGSLNLHGYLLEGTELYLSYGNPNHIAEQVDARLEALARFAPEAILLYSCIVRKEFWDDLVDVEMEPFDELAPTCGFHTWGEVLRDPRSGEVVEHNVTLVSVGLREGGLPAQLPAAPHVDNKLLGSQALNLQRLTNLIDSTMHELRAAHEELRRLNQQLLSMAEHDALTGLYNRGSIERQINDALAQAAVHELTLSLVMLDIDHFKQVNDQHGHAAGDAALRDVAELLDEAASSCEGGRAGRWGGEEFFLMLPGVDEQAAYEMAERLRLRAASHAFGKVGHLTISLGVITVAGPCDRQLVYSRVDEALYRAKTKGRNRTVQAQAVR